MRVRAIMQRDVPTLRPGDAYRHIARTLLVTRMRALPVVDSRARILGVVSESDLLNRSERSRRFGVRNGHRVSSRATAHELMTAPAITVSPCDSVLHAAEVAARADVRQLRVVGAFCSDLVGVDVAVRDGVATLCGQLEHEGLHASFVRAVAAVPGVIGIDDQLTWPAPPRPAGIHAFYMYAL